MDQTQDLELYKEIMGNYPTGVTIITTTDSNDNPVGLTVNSFASVSLDPLLVLWSIKKDSNSLTTFENADKFAVNILSGQQKEAVWAFSSSKEKNRFEKVSWEYSQNNLPIINDAYSLLECEKVEQIDAGDHYIFLGKVIDLSKNNADPMLYYARNVGSIPENWDA